jgi:hypothetical protein
LLSPPAPPKVSTGGPICYRRNRSAQSLAASVRMAGHRKDFHSVHSKGPSFSFSARSQIRLMAAHAWSRLKALRRDKARHLLVVSRNDHLLAALDQIEQADQACFSPRRRRLRALYMLLTLRQLNLA